MAESSRLSGLIYAARGVGSRGASIAAAFAMTAIILNTLPPDQGGRFSTSYAVLLGIATVARCGLESLLLKLSAADPGFARPLLRATGVSVAGLGALGAAALAGFLLLYIHGVAWWTLLLMASTVIPLNGALVAGSLLRGVGRITAGSIAELGSVPAITFTEIFVARVAHLHVHFGHVLLMFAIAVYATAAWSVPLALRAVRRESTPQPAIPLPTLWREHGHSLRQFMITGLGYYLFANVPLIVLGYRPTQAAHFNAARTLANLVATVPTIQISYLAPRFAHLFHRRDLVALNRLIRTSTITGTVVAGLMALPLIVFPRQIMHLYKAAFADASLTLQILAVAVLAQVVVGPVQGLLVTCGFERQAARITLVMLVAGTAGMIVALPWGAPAVAAVNGLANLGFFVTGAVLLRRHEGIVSPLGPSLRRAAEAA